MSQAHVISSEDLVVASDSSSTFLSYSRDDSGFVLKLARDLKAASAVIWMDQLDIAPGKRWDGAIQDALASCSRLLLVLSPSSVVSENVLDEVNFAVENHKMVIPVLYLDCDVPFRLRRLQYVDLKSDYDRGLQELLRTLQASGDGQAAAAAPDVLATPYRASTKAGRGAVSHPSGDNHKQGSAALLGGSATTKVSIGAGVILVLSAVLWFQVRTHQPNANVNQQTTNVVGPSNQTNVKPEPKPSPPDKNVETKDHKLNTTNNSSGQTGKAVNPQANLASNPEYQQLQQRLVQTQEEAKSAEGFWAPIKASLASSGQTLRPQIQTALGTLARSTDNASRSLRGGDLTGARMSLDTADQQMKILEHYQNE